MKWKSRKSSFFADLPKVEANNSGEKLDHRNCLIRILTAMLCQALAFFIFGLAFWAISPCLLGSYPTTVMSNSMAPAIHAGDVVVLKKIDPDALKIGQVPQVDDPDEKDRLRLHRIVAITQSKNLITRGDNSDHDDYSQVPVSHVHGVVYLVIPWLGIPLRSFHEGHYAIGVISIILLVTLLAGTQIKPRCHGTTRNHLKKKNGFTPATLQ